MSAAMKSVTWACSRVKFVTGPAVRSARAASASVSRRRASDARFVEAHARVGGERRRGDGVLPAWAGVGDGPAKDVVQQGVGFGDDVLARVGRAVVGCGDECLDQTCQGMVVGRGEGPGKVTGVAVAEGAGDVGGVDGPHGYLRGGSGNREC
jgi:hypothetical protein